MKKLTEEIFELAESPRFIDGELWFTDIDRGYLYRWKDGAPQIVFEHMITSFVKDCSGGLVCGTMDGLYYLKPDGDLIQLTEQSSLKINDMCADPNGRVVFGTNYHSMDQQYALGSLYVYDQNGIRELDYGYHLVNGIGFSPDGSKMYVCDSSVRTVFEYPYDIATGTCGKKKILVRFRMDDGLPDGMAIDNEGNIWTAQWYGNCVVCTAPDGKELQRISVPAAQVSALEFSPDGLYITSAHEYGRLDIAPHSFSPDDPGIGGSLFLADVSVKGNPHAQSNIYGI